MKRYARSFEGDPVSLGYDMSRTQLADSSKAWINLTSLELLIVS